MLLQRDDIVASAFGVPASAQGLSALVEELGLPPENFIFLHADPAECAAVEEALPDVLTLQAPEDPEEIPGWLSQVWAFDRGNTFVSRVER